MRFPGLCALGLLPFLPGVLSPNDHMCATHHTHISHIHTCTHIQRHMQYAIYVVLTSAGLSSNSCLVYSPYIRSFGVLAAEYPSTQPQLECSDRSPWTKWLVAHTWIQMLWKLGGKLRQWCVRPAVCWLARSTACFLACFSSLKANHSRGAG